MHGKKIIQIAFIAAFAALMSSVAGAQCSVRGSYARHHDRYYVVSPAYREIVVAHGGGYGHGRAYRHGTIHDRRRWGR